MKRWRIENTRSGVVLGTYRGETEGEALDELTRDAGYRDYREACEVTNDYSPLLVTPVMSPEGS